MSRPRPLLVRVLVIKQGSQWLAQGLDYNVAAQAPDSDAAISSLLRIIQAHLKRDAALGREPFQGVPEAPEHFLRLWQEAEGHAKCHPVERRSDDDAAIPPAYILEAIADSGTGLNS